MRDGIVSVDERDLLGRTPEFLAAITLHECAHSTLTRLHRIAPDQIHNNPVEFSLINAIEDGRIETWLGDWLPGSAPWLASTQSTLIGELHRRNPDVLGKNPAMDFCLGLLLMRHGLPAPDPLHPATTEALTETSDDIHAYFDSYPRFDLLEGRGPEIIADYTASPLPACFAAHDGPIRPDAMEMAVRLAQYRAWLILHEKIRPVYLRLVSMDPSTRHALMMHQFMQRLSWDRDPQPSNGDERAAARDFREMQRRMRQRHDRKFNVGNQPGGETRRGSGESYAKARSRHASVINRLSDALLDLRRTHGRFKWSAGHAYGHEPDLRVAMEFTATGRHHDRMWRRRQLPHRIAPALVLLADRSSSMQGPRAQATFASAVILAEVCRRAGLPLSVVVYHTQAKVLLGFGDDSAGRAAAGSMEGILQAEGGTRIVPALEAADALIATSPHREHLVICVADGEFDDRERTKFEAITSRWSRSTVRLAGLGLGPQTEGIARWFPGAQGNLAPSDLSDEVTRLISSFVSELYGLQAA
jgi:Mg-chelatase subunit ChlD